MLNFRTGLICASMIVAAASGRAASVSYNFGSDTGMLTSNASSSTTGVALNYPLVLSKTFPNSLVITSNTGDLFCAVGVTAGTCGNATGLTTGTAYGLGVGDGRIDAGVADVLTFTVQPGFIATLTSFSVTGFSGSEQIIYHVNGGPAITRNAPNFNVALDTFFGFGQGFNTLAFSAASGGNYSLAQITFNVTAAPTPEPATFGFMAGGIAALALARRKR